MSWGGYWVDAKNRFHWNWNFKCANQKHTSWSRYIIKSSALLWVHRVTAAPQKVTRPVKTRRSDCGLSYTIKVQVLLETLIRQNTVGNMVRCWFMDDKVSDQRLEHHRTPEQFCGLEDLFKKTGVEYFHVIAQNL